MSWKRLNRKQPLPTWQYCPRIYLTLGHYFYFISQLSADTSCWCVYHINITIQLITHTGSRTAEACNKQQLSNYIRILCDLVSVSHFMVAIPSMYQGYVLCEVRALGKETRHKWDSVRCKNRLSLKKQFNSEHTIQHSSQLTAFRYRKLMLYLVQL
jgi:hypothetical protein